MSENDAPQDKAKTEGGEALVAPVQFLGQYIKDLSFEVPHAPDIYNLLRQKTPEIPISLHTSVQHVNAGVFEVTLNVHLEAVAGDKTAFILELAYGCIVEVSQQALPEEQVHPFLHIEVARQLYPFVRQIVSDMTVGGGFPPLLLQIVDFNEIYRKKFANAGDPTAPGAAAAPQPATSH